MQYSTKYNAHQEGVRWILLHQSTLLTTVRVSLIWGFTNYFQFILQINIFETSGTTGHVM